MAEENLSEAEAGGVDVAMQPASNADNPAEVRKYISDDIFELYEIHSYRHAAAILGSSFSEELSELENSLRAFGMTSREIEMPGGNESEIPKKFSRILRPLGWQEARIHGDLYVFQELSSEAEGKDGKWRKKRLPAADPVILENYLDGHLVDYVKGQVAFDLEWNSKDQTFDRDLYAFRTFHECGIIAAGVLVTRSASLNPVFEVLPRRNKSGTIDRSSNGQEITCKAKYGASTTWMGKLLYRLNAARHGGCPVLVVGITPKQIVDWANHERNPNREN